MIPLHIIILAAGQGKRMHSAMSKVLHPVGGKSMLERVIDVAHCLNPAGIHVVIGHGGEQIQTTLSSLPVHWVWQNEQLGTGHAVMQALPSIPAHSQVLVLSGDVPLIQADSLQTLLGQCNADQGNTPLGLLVASMPDPTGLGRILRDQQGNICAIVEEKDASTEQKRIQEIYTGICCASVEHLTQWLPQLNSKNAQGEYYLTDIIALAVHEQLPIVSLQVTNTMDVQGVNNRLQLQQIERQWQMRVTTQLMLSGVTMADAARVDIRGDVQCGKDVFIDVNVVFKGRVVIGDGCTIGPNCVLTNVTIGHRCEIAANSVLENCTMDDECHIGPFARLRPGTQLAAKCRVGNFVEIKNATFGVGSKANHLSYIGDARIGSMVNIGAGTITCNYDGVNKHQTIIEDNVNIGSDTQLVAPVTVGKNATIGAGSTIRKNAPAGELTLTTSMQKTVSGWTRPKKKEHENESTS